MRIILILFLFLFIPSAWADEQDPTTQQTYTKIQDYPIQLRPLSDKALFRITMENIEYNYKYSEQHGFWSGIRKVEIIDDGKVIFQSYPEPQDAIFLLTLIDFKILKGGDFDYLAYSVYNDHGPTFPNVYKLIRFNKNNKGLELVKLKGEIFANESLIDDKKIDFHNPKINEHMYSLIEDKYIISDYHDGCFTVRATFEIINDAIEEVDKENKVLSWVYDRGNNDIYCKIRKTGIIPFYTTKSLTNFINASISVNSKIKILGAQHVKIGGLTHDGDDGFYVLKQYEDIAHVSIDGKEGWVDAGNLSLMANCEKF